MTDMTANAARTAIPADRIPVIVGVGEISDHPTNPAEGLEPVALIVAALRRAEADAGSTLLRDLDSLDVVNFVSWRYHDPAQLICKQLGIAPARANYGPVGGESPIRFLHEAAQRIARGESKVAAVAGGEAQSTATKAERAGITLPWTPFAHDVPSPLRGAHYQHPLAVALGLAQPVAIYPLYDAATAAHWGQSPRAALAESGALWSRYAAVAATNPQAWLKRTFDGDTITTPTADNRLIAWPYTKLMVANPSVNQSAAIIVTSLAHARAAGIPDSRLVYVHGGASAEEPRDILGRDQFYQSHAQNAVLGEARSIADGNSFDAIELYSCFPCVPKMARRTLGLGENFEPTVTGGLTFFGAPLNDYMAHAACAMTRRIRSGARLGLLYGQGGYVTKHHALVLSPQPPRTPLEQDTSVQAKADAARDKVPGFVTEASGAATLETFTILYNRKGEAEHGVAVLRTAPATRALARVPADDAATLARLTDGEATPIGIRGAIRTAGDGILEWRAAS